MTTLARSRHICDTEEALLQWASELAKAVEKKAVIFLSGPLGAGKTTFARGFLRGLGYLQKVKSPTYTLVEPYEIAGKKLFHFDLYRLQQPHELVHLGLEDYLQPEAICLIEWPENGAPFLPQADVVCLISLYDQGRLIDLSAHTLQGKKILELMSKNK